MGKKKSSWLLDMFQLDLSKIKEVQTDESLRGTGKMPVDVLAFVYTLRERKILSQRSSLTTERKTTAIKPGAGKEGKGLICFTALTFTSVWLYHSFYHCKPPVYWNGCAGSPWAQNSFCWEGSRQGGFSHRAAEFSWVAEPKSLHLATPQQWQRPKVKVL